MGEQGSVTAAVPRYTFDHVANIAAALRDVVGKSHRAGTHRAIAPETTLRRLSGLLAPAGITRVATVTGLDKIGIPVVMVCRPNARSLAVSQGKGIDLVSAKVSGIMEALEAYHAEYADLPVQVDSYHRLSHRHDLIAPERIARQPGTEFDPSAAIPWVAGYDVMTGREMWVPYEIVHMDYTMDALARSTCVFSRTSTGLASGNHLQEALGHAIYELVERDALMLWRLSGMNALSSRLALEAVTDPACVALLERFRMAGISVYAWDVTSDIDMPVYVVLICDGGDRPIGGVSTAAGAGCHLDAAIALSRALTEAAQSRLTLIAGSRDDISPAPYGHMVDLLSRVQAERRIVAATPDHAMPMQDHQAGKTLGDDIATCLKRLRAVGLDQVIVVDLTKPGFDIPVVRAIIPGLELCMFGDNVAQPGARARRSLLDRDMRAAFARARDRDPA